MTELKEYPLHQDLIKKIPKKLVFTFSSIDVKITCFDFTSSHFVFGTNAGCAFLLHRETGHVIKLLCESKQDHVSCIKLLVGLECQVAFGTKDGKLLLVIFSKSLAGPKEVQKYCIDQVHKSPVSSLEWSVNGMKLFSGDLNGEIFCQQLDLNLKTCGSNFVLKEDSEIVQIEYRHKILLVSTVEKSFLFDNGEKVMIGSKFTRKGKFGACFSADSIFENKLKVFAARPGMRIWVADTSGTVLSTLKLKDIAESSDCIIKLQNNQDFDVNNKELVFGVVKLFGSDCLVTYHGTSLYVINHEENKIIGEVHNLLNVIETQVSNDEIHILCDDAKLYRIAYGPDNSLHEFPSSNQQDHIQDSSRMQDVKESFSEVKKSITPVFDSLQSKMSSFSIGSFTNKIQTQAKDFKQKVSSLPIAEVTEHLKFSRGKSTYDKATSSHSEDIVLNNAFEMSARVPSSPRDDIPNITVDQAETGIIGNLLSEMINIVETKEGDDQQHAAGVAQNDLNVRIRSESNVSEQSYKGFRFEQIEFEEAEELVFSSKQRKRKPQKSLGKAISSSSESEKQTESMRESEDTELPLEPSDQANPIRLSKFEDSLRGEKEMKLNHKVSSNDQPTLDKNLTVYSTHIPENVQENSENLAHNDSTAVDASVQKEEVHTASRVQELTSCDTREGIKNNPYHLESSREPCLSLLNDLQSNSSDLTTSKLSSNAPIEEHETLIPDIYATAYASDSVSNDQPSTSFAHDHDDLKEERHSAGPQSSDTDIYRISPDVDVESDAASSTEAVETTSVFGRSILDSAEYQDTCDDEYFNAVRLDPEFYGDFDSLKSLDRWSVHIVPSDSLNCLSGSEEIVCYINNNHRVYCIKDSAKHKLVWNKLTKKAIHIAISPSGDFAWLVTSKGNIYSASLPVDISDNSGHVTEVNLNWQAVNHGASFVCLGATESWIVDWNGKLTRHCGLSRSVTSNSQSALSVDIRFLNDNVLVTHPIKVVQVALTSEVVWLLVSDGNILCRTLDSLDSHSCWNSVELPRSDDDDEHTVKLVTSDYQNTMFVVDLSHKLWFRSNVTKSNPNGDLWWQVHLNEYLYQQHRKRLPLHHSTNIDQLTSWVSDSVSVTSVAVSFRSVWVASGHQKLHITRTPITGNRWQPANLIGVASSTRWSHITSSSTFSPASGTWEGFIWVTQAKGDIACFSSQPDKQRVVAVSPPLSADSVVASVSASREAVWMVYGCGAVYARFGISPDSPTGLAWSKVNVSSQLGSTKLVHVSCGSLCVWIVNKEGSVFVRMGVNVTKNQETMAPAWLSIDACNSPGCKFTQVACGPSDISVWALDDHGNAYVRTGVTYELPVGEAWKAVQGPAVQNIAISNHTVWALCKDGNILRRCGITHNDCLGDYWQKMPASFKNLAVTPYDELWAIDGEDRLRRRVTHIYYPPLLETMRDDVHFDAPLRSDLQDSRPDASWEFI